MSRLPTALVSPPRGRAGGHPSEQTFGWHKFLLCQELGQFSSDAPVFPSFLPDIVRRSSGTPQESIPQTRRKAVVHFRSSRRASLAVTVLFAVASLPSPSRGSSQPSPTRDTPCEGTVSASGLFCQANECPIACGTSDVVVSLPNGGEGTGRICKCGSGPEPTPESTCCTIAIVPHGEGYAGVTYGTCALPGCQEGSCSLNYNGANHQYQAGCQ